MSDNKAIFNFQYITIYIIESAEDLVPFLYSINLQEVSASTVKLLHNIFDMLSYPVTVVSEERYADKVYNDSYDALFSKKYTEYERFCKRLSFFTGAINDLTLFSHYDKETESFLQSRFVGTCILRPIVKGAVGQTIISADKLHMPPSSIQTARFSFSVIGHHLTADAYMFSSQDAEIMTCAETTIWNILEYYAHKHTKYQGIKLSRVLREIDNISSERSLPSFGLTFSQLCKLLKHFDICPKMHSLIEFEQNNNKDLFRNIFHCYVDSGFPLAVGVSGKDDEGLIQHAITCIGYSNNQCTLRQVYSSPIQKIGSFPCIRSSDLYNEYIFMDDGESPYHIASFSKPLNFAFSRIERFIVPLHENLYMDAIDADIIATTILQSDFVGLSDYINNIGETINLDNPLVVRPILIPSEDYINARARGSTYLSEISFYASLRLPEYIWVIEISSLRMFNKRVIFGEIVLDSAATRVDSLDSVILLRCLDRLCFRTPKERFLESVSSLEYKIAELHYPYPRFDANLEFGEIIEEM